MAHLVIRERFSPKKMIAGTLTILFFGAVTGCKSTSFSGSGKKPGSGGSGPNTPGRTTGGTGGDTPGTTGEDKPEDLIFDSGKGCFKTMPKLHFMFAIDKTASMDPSIQAVIDNVGSFAKKIGTITPNGSAVPFKDSQFAAVTYLDREAENKYVEWTKDANSFSTALRTHNTNRGSGDDACEGGLQAVRNGLSRLSQSFKAGESVVPIMIIVSDNFSHQGTGSNNARDFADDTVITAAQLDGLKPLMVIDAVPNTPNILSRILGGVGSCNSGFSLPSEQWQVIRSKIAEGSGRDPATMGESIGFQQSFNSEALLTRIPSLIEKSVKICE
jgi:hypothetical protein